VCHVHAGKIVTVHHCLELVERRVDEERWVGAAATAPYDVGRDAMIPFDSLFDDARTFLCGRHVGADGVEMLRFCVTCALRDGFDGFF
jgi:hypothetical protein